MWISETLLDVSRVITNHELQKIVSTKKLICHYLSLGC